MAISSYLDVLSAHYECVGEDGITDSVGAANFVEQGTVPEVTDGKFGNARGPCDGNFPGSGFSRTPTLGGAWDTRVSQGFVAGTLTGWARLDSVGNDQEFWSQARAGQPDNTKQAMLRVVHSSGGVDSPVIFVWDHALNQFQAITAGRSGVGAMPTGEWFYVGFSVDLDYNSGDGILRASVGIASETLYQNSLTPISQWDPFQAVDLDVVLLGQGSGHSTGGVEGDIDHVSWYNGYAFDETDFSNHWGDSLGLSYPGQYTIPSGSPSGKTRPQRARYYHWNKPRFL